MTATGFKSDVNLLDCEREPSDAQLEQLMRSVAADARARAGVANQELRATLAREAAAVRQRYHLNTREAKS